MPKVISANKFFSLIGENEVAVTWCDKQGTISFYPPKQDSSLMIFFFKVDGVIYTTRQIVKGSLFIKTETDQEIKFFVIAGGGKIDIITKKKNKK